MEVPIPSCYHFRSFNLEYIKQVEEKKNYIWNERNLNNELAIVTEKIPSRDFGQRCKRVGVDNLEIYEYGLVFCSVQTSFAAEEQNRSEKKMMGAQLK